MLKEQVYNICMHEIYIFLIQNKHNNHILYPKYTQKIVDEGTIGKLHEMIDDKDRTIYDKDQTISDKDRTICECLVFYAQSPFSSSYPIFIMYIDKSNEEKLLDEIKQLQKQLEGIDYIQFFSNFFLQHHNV